MPNVKVQVKQETRVPKIKISNNIAFHGRLKEAESTVCGRTEHITDTPQVRIPCVDQSRRGINTSTRRVYHNNRVPVIDRNNTPLMPTKASRARKWIKSGKATPFWKNGIFCIRINFKPLKVNKQNICLGIDPGSKFEGFTVKASHATFVNIQLEAVTWVKDKIEVRRNMRRKRRNRNTPYRKPKFFKNRKKTFLPPSTKARWQAKLRIINRLKKIYPITNFCIEDINFKPICNKRNWNKSFSPLVNGKNWFYTEIKKLGTLTLKRGYETKNLRDELSLIKNKNKSVKAFNAHCVDSWVLARCVVGGNKILDNVNVLYVRFLRFHRRQLHYLQPSKRGIRRTYGGTRSLGFKRGSIVKHSKYGFVCIGGNMNNKLSLLSFATGKRLCQNAKPEELRFLTFNSWIVNFKGQD